VTVDQILQQEIKDTEVYLNREQEESTYKRDLIKRIELINWVLENMKNPDVEICSLIESRMNDVVLTINQTHDIFESDKLHSELRILDWIFYQVCTSLQPSVKETIS
jgi:hypothetical protein